MTDRPNLGKKPYRPALRLRCPNRRPLPARHSSDCPRTAQCVTTGDLEGVFSSSSEMGDYLECILQLLPEWTKRVYKQMPMPDGFQFVPAGHSSLVGTKRAGCAVTDGVLAYCKLDRQVYFGEMSV